MIRRIKREYADAELGIGFLFLIVRHDGGCKSVAWLHGTKKLIGNIGLGSLVLASGLSSRKTAKPGEKEVVIATYSDFDFGITRCCVQNWDECRKSRVKASGLNDCALDEAGGRGRGPLLR